MLVCVVGVLDMEMAYPLVNMQKNCGKAPCFMAKSTINGQFSIVTSKCRRVYPLVDNFFYFVWPIFRWCLCSKPCLFTSWMGVLKTTSNDLTPNSFWNWWFRSKRNHGPKHKRDSHWMFHGCSPGNATAFHGSMGPGTEKLPDLWCGISGWQLAFRDGTLIIQVNYRYMFCYMWLICSHIIYIYI